MLNLFHNAELNGLTLPIKADADRWSTHAETHVIFLELVIKVLPRNDHLAPAAECIPDAYDALPGVIGVTSTEVEVVRHEPLVLGTKHRAAFEANDSIPVVGV